MQHLTDVGTYEAKGPAANYREHLRVPSMSLGTYCIPAGAEDPQKPHQEDEVYIVTAGRARFTSAGQTVDIAPGHVLFVPAHEDHRFSSVTEDLTLLVVFAPAESV
jgi:mannose-6-phosphate isomerase-like protein (cupin superfamily)